MAEMSKPELDAVARSFMDTIAYLQGKCADASANCARLIGEKRALEAENAALKEKLAKQQGAPAAGE